MSGPWPEDDDEVGRPAAPLPPDDRLWRHPSELSWERAQVQAAAVPVSAKGAAGPGRFLLVTVSAGVFGAALALGVLAVNGALEPGGPERIVERVGIREVLADPLDPDPGVGLADVVAATSPSVVGVEGSSAAGETAGSGVVLLDDGHIVTAAELVAGADEVRVVLADGTELTAEVLAVDEITDVAVLVTSAPAGGPAWRPAVRGDASDLRVGDPTAAVGGPTRRGGEPAVALGLVRAVDQMGRSSGGWTLTGLIATDMRLDAHVLGGALVDRAGRVVGLITDVGGAAGPLGLTTPIDRAWAAVEAALDGTDGVVWLGIEGSDREVPTTSLAGMVATRAVEVHAVVPDSPADSAGIRSGDLLVSLDGEAVASMGDLVVALRRHEPGERVDVGVLRDGEHLAVDVILGSTDG